jgi:hypothetical protein
VTFDKTATAEISESLYDFVVEAGLGREPESDSLFHYTSADGLQGIVGSGQMFASHGKFFNDTSEYEYGLGLLGKPLEALKVVGLGEVRDHILSSFAGHGGYEIFVSCFCEADDLVPQWRGYAAAGAGYSLGLPWRPLSRSGRALLTGVVYGDAAVVEATERAIALATTKAAAATKAGDAAALLDVVTSLMVTLLLLIICAKKAVFSYEREFRLVHLLSPSEMAKANPVEFRNSQGLIIPFVRLPVPRDKEGHLEVTSVRCGPSLHDSATEYGVRMFLNQHDLSTVPILRSDAPLRWL